MLFALKSILLFNYSGFLLVTVLMLPFSSILLLSVFMYFYISDVFCKQYNIVFFPVRKSLIASCKSFTFNVLTDINRYKLTIVSNCFSMSLLMQVSFLSFRIIFLFLPLYQLRSFTLMVFWQLEHTILTYQRLIFILQFYFSPLDSYVICRYELKRYYQFYVVLI